MSGFPKVDRRSVRRQETKSEIVAAAWVLVREHGLSGLAMRDLGDRVGMKAQSIYQYFSSKHEIYDAMFGEGYRAYADAIARSVDDERLTIDPVGEARAMARAFVDFCTSDPIRYQLLFQRTIPGFVPSLESYAVAVASYDEMTERLAAMGIRGQAEVDLWTAVITGLTSQQISNDPGGDRWTRLVDRAVDLLLDNIGATPDPAREQA